MATFPTLEEIKAALGIDPTDTSKDAALTSTLESTIAIVERYLGRGIAHADEVQEFDPPDAGNPSLLLFRFPVEDVDSVLIDSQAVNGWRLYKQPGILRWHSGCCIPSRDCCREFPSIIVSYTGGYPDDAWPADLLEAVLQVFYARWAATDGTGNLAQATAPGGAIRSVSVDGLFISYDSPTYAGSGFDGVVMPAAVAPVAAILDPYRQRFLTGV